jgi:uncharacterized protein YeaO (DUF488 family)
MHIRIHRIYEDDEPKGYRVLVDRLWPRGISKKAARLDAHWKELAPSHELRKWFDHDPAKWREFKKQYEKELRENQSLARELAKGAGEKSLVLLYGAKDKQYNHAIILKEYLEDLFS